MTAAIPIQAMAMTMCGVLMIVVVLSLQQASVDLDAWRSVPGVCPEGHARTAPGPPDGARRDGTAEPDMPLADPFPAGVQANGGLLDARPGGFGASFGS